MLETIDADDRQVLMLGGWAPGNTAAPRALTSKVVDFVETGGWSTLEGDLLLTDESAPPFTVDSRTLAQEETGAEREGGALLRQVVRGRRGAAAAAAGVPGDRLDPPGPQGRARRGRRGRTTTRPASRRTSRTSSSARRTCRRTSPHRPRRHRSRRRRRRRPRRRPPRRRRRRRPQLDQAVAEPEEEALARQLLAACQAGRLEVAAQLHGEREDQRLLGAVHGLRVRVAALGRGRPAPRRPATPARSRRTSPTPCSRPRARPRRSRRRRRRGTTPWRRPPGRPRPAGPSWTSCPSRPRSPGRRSREISLTASWRFWVA